MNRSPRIRRFEQAGSQGVQLDGGADGSGCCVLGLHAEEAPDASARLQNPRSRNASETQRQQPIPDSHDHIGTGEERVQTRPLERLPLTLVHQGAQALPALDPGVVHGPVGAQSERRLERAVAETTEARQDCPFLGRGWATLSRQRLEESERRQVGLEACHGPDDEVSRRTDVVLSAGLICGTEARDLDDG